jgi:hypothetical protein
MVHFHPKELTMQRIKFAFILGILLALGSNARAQTPAAFRVLFGVTDVTITPLGRHIESHTGRPIQPGALAI